jgi:hypothetical protein
VGGIHRKLGREQRQTGNLSSGFLESGNLFTNGQLFLNASSSECFK